MIRRLTTARTILLAAAALAAPSLASSADLDNEVRKEAGITPVEYASGWYLRGDIGTYHGAGTVGFALGGNQEFVDAPFFDNVAIDVGVGYIFNDNLRADFTISHFGDFLLGGLSDLGGCGAGYTGECLHNTSATADVTDFSLNGYWSLGSWSGVTPYLGSGVGLALVRWGDYDSQLYCVLDPGETCAGATHSGGPGREILPAGAEITNHFRSTAVSFSLMAGADYRLTDSLTLDFGYRFTRLIDVGLNDGGTDVGEINDLNVHQISAGLRYEIW